MIQLFSSWFHHNKQIFISLNLIQTNINYRNIKETTLYDYKYYLGILDVPMKV